MAVMPAYAGDAEALPHKPVRPPSTTSPRAGATAAGELPDDDIGVDFVPPPPRELAFQIGDDVAIRGLHGAGYMNGKVGQIVQFAPDIGGWHVKLDDGTKAFKAENLALHKTAPSSSAPTCTTPRTSLGAAAVSTSAPTGTTPPRTSSGRQAQSRTPCKFLAEGSCKYGASCHYLHEVAGGPPPPAPAAAAAANPTASSGASGGGGGSGGGESGGVAHDADLEFARQLQAQEHARATQGWSRRPIALVPRPQTMGAPGGQAEAAPDAGSTHICQSNCGLPARKGRNREGRRYKFCCRGCQNNMGQHDGRCGQESLSPGATGDPTLDASLAMAYQLQMEEVEMFRERNMRSRIANGMCYVCDPIWGEVEFAPLNADDGWGKRWLRIVAASCFRECPCCMITCHCYRGHLKRKFNVNDIMRGWRIIIVSFSSFLALVQLAIFVYSILMYGMVSKKENPMFGPPVYAMNILGAKNAARILTYNEWWRLATPIMLHGGWLHILPNILLQLRIGIVLENSWGSTSWLVVYIISGLYASICSCILMKDSLGVGSSGALCGLMGAWVPFMMATWNQTLPRDIGPRNMQFFMVVTSIILMVPLSFLPMVDFAAHVGGTVMGVAVGAIIFAGRLQTRNYKFLMRIAGIVGVLLLLPFSLYWFLEHTKPNGSLLNICPPPGCRVMAAPTPAPGR